MLLGKPTPATSTSTIPDSRRSTALRLKTGMGWWWSSGSSGPGSDPNSTTNDCSHHSSDTRNHDNDQQRSSSGTSPKPTDWNSSLNSLHWSSFTEPQNLIPTVLLTGGILFVVHVQRRYLRRFPEAADITSSYFRQRSLLGRVTSVGDGDNFRIYHTPGGRLVGWGWLPWMKVPTSKKELKDRTVCVLITSLSRINRAAK